MSDQPRPRARAATIAVLTGLGLACGVLCAGLFYWWWSAQPEFNILIGASYTPVPPGEFFGNELDTVGPAVRPWLYLALVGSPTLLGLLAGLGAAGAGWRFARR